MTAKRSGNTQLQAVEKAINQLQELTPEAIETLHRNLHCENPAVEIRTAQIIIDGGINGLAKLSELIRLEKESAFTDWLD